MNRIVITPELRLVLAALREEAELVDENGVPLGRFVPDEKPTDNGCPYSDEELEKAYASPGRNTTESVMKRLRGL